MRCRSVFLMCSSVLGTEVTQPDRSSVTSVLGQFGPQKKDRSDRGPKWPRTEVDVERPVSICLSVTNRSSVETAKRISLVFGTGHRRQRRMNCRGRDPQYLTCRGCPVLTTPQYFDKCFIFFPSAELLNTASRCHFHLQCAQCTVFN